MMIIRRLLAFLLTVILVPFTFAVLLTQPLSGLPKQADDITALLAERDVYGQLTKSAGELAASALQEVLREIPIITAGDIQQLLPQAITPRWLQTQVESNLGTFIDWWESGAPDLALPLDAGGLRRNIQQAVQTAAETKAAQLPECTREQLLELARSAGDAWMQLACLPPDASVADLSTFLTFGVDAFLGAVPEQVDLLTLIAAARVPTSPVDPADPAAAAAAQLEVLTRISEPDAATLQERELLLGQLRSTRLEYQRALTMWRWLVIADVVAVLVLLLLLLDRPRLLARWLAVCAALVGVLLGASFVFVGYFVPTLVLATVGNMLKQLVPTAQPLLADVTGSVFRSVVASWSFSAGVSAAVFAGLLVLSFFLPKERRRSAEKK